MTIKSRFLSLPLPDQDITSSTVSPSVVAEYKAITVSVYEFSRILFQDLGRDILNPTKLYFNNQALLDIRTNSVFLERTKYIEIGYHVV